MKTQNQVKHTPERLVVSKDHRTDCMCIVRQTGAIIWIDFCPLHKAAPKLLEFVKKISKCHESGNNGAYMGEAVLCPMFASMAKDLISKAESK